MDPQRAKKARSLGTDPNQSVRQPTPTTITASTAGSKRLELGERHNSVPSVARQRQSDAKRNSESSKASDRTRRISKASSRDDPSVHHSSTNAGDSQTSERDRNSAFSVKSSVKSIDKDRLPLLTFVVVGNTGVGKSNFIRNALDLRSSSVPLISASKVSLGGVLYRLQLVETQRHALKFVHGKILWPTESDSGTPSHVDGALVLYDVSDEDSLEGLPQILAALSVLGTATCLVSCKADTPLCDQEVPQEFLAKVKSKFPKVVFEESSVHYSDSAKRSLLKILKASLAASEAKLSHLPGRPKSEPPNGPSAFPPRTSSRNPSTESSRSRSNSRHRPMHSKSRDNLLTGPPPAVPESEDEDDSEEPSSDENDRSAASTSKEPLRVNTTDLQQQQQRQRGAHPQTPVSTTQAPGQRPSPSHRPAAKAPDTPESYMGATKHRRGSVDTTDSRTVRTFLNMDDESLYEEGDPVEQATEKMKKMSTSEEAIGEGVTFQELVDRLLAMPTSKGDQKFVPAFLCLYRAFATPLRLLSAIIQKFVKTEESGLVAFTKTAELLRYLSVLGLWSTYYPGDFADGKVRETATQFITTVEKTKNYAAAARQVLNNLQTFVPDDDEDWAFGDAANAVRSRSNTTSQKSSSSTPSKSLGVRQRQGPKSKDDDSDSDNNTRTPSSRRHSATASSASSQVKGSQVSSQTSDNLHNLETARDNARKLRTIPHNHVSKTQWHQFLSCSTEELAVEITRIDWTMYSAIRPRDFVRYVTISNSQRTRPGHVDYISMMTKHFNHLALFVSGMILLRDKPKHRAKMLEKFMDLAWKVRQMNNYHALGAIVAALNSEEIVRLTQTQELIPQEHQKQFLRLKILMGHQKSHAAYRMAWENSSAERIPFLPRVQEDLTKAATGNATFVGGKIKWTKFEVMGETIVNIQRSQEQPYNFPDRTARGHEIDKLILETRVLEGDEDCADPQQELYERSKQVEPPTTGGERKKFDWLRR